MDTNTIFQLISTIGFPIAMCLILCKYIQTTQKSLIEKMGDIAQSVALLCSIVGEDGKNDKNK